MFNWKHPFKIIPVLRWHNDLSKINDISQIVHWKSDNISDINISFEEKNTIAVLNININTGIYFWSVYNLFYKYIELMYILFSALPDTDVSMLKGLILMKEEW